MASSTDPNNWVKNPPSTVCKIEGTSRDTLNGRFSLILQWNGQRYTVLLVETQQQVALKPENLAKCGYIDTAKAYYQLALHSPEIQAQLTQFQRSIETTTGLSLRTAAIAAVVAFIVGIYFIGFTRLWILVIVAGTGLYLTNGRRTSPSIAWQRWRTLLATQVPAAVTRYPYAMELITVLLGALMAYTFIAAGGSRSVARGAATAAAADTDYYYKLGFEDATAGRSFGTSLVQTPPDEQDSMDTPWDRGLVAPKQSPWTISTAMSLFLIGRTVYSLGQTGGGWDFRLAMANLQHMDMMRAGFLALGVYRVVSAFLL